MPPCLSILMLCPQYRPLVGGYERAAERLSIALAARGHRVTIITERRNSTWPKQEDQDGVRVRRLGCLYRPRLHMATSLLAFAVFLLIHGRRFQVWHIHQYGLHAALAVALGKLLRRPVVLKSTSSKDQGIHRATQGLPSSRITAGLLRRVDAVIATTRETRAEALAFGIPESRAPVIGNGVDILTFRPRGDTQRARLREELGIVASGILLFVGRLSEEKGLDDLLHAWKKALPDLPDSWKLVLIGDGPMRERLATFVVAEDLSSSVDFAGYQGNVETWMAVADIFVLTSHREGLANTMLEAMATGLPVVSTRVSGTTELLEETGAGTLVDIGDMERFAEAISNLVADPEQRARMGRAARAVIKARYGIDSITERHESLYRDLIDDVTSVRRVS